MKSQSKFIHFHSTRCIWKCHLRNSGHFVSASMCWWAHKANLIKILICLVMENCQIMPQFFTCHDSWAVMVCAKVWHDWGTIIKVKTKRILARCQYGPLRPVSTSNKRQLIVAKWCHIDGLVQDCSNSSALAMELLQSCTKPLIWHYKTWSVLVQITACCLMAPSHYLNQCWLIISKVQCHSSGVDFPKDTWAINH